MKNLLNKFSLDYIEDMPLAPDEVDKDSWGHGKGHYHPVDGIWPYERVKRFLTKNIGKSFALTFSYYCKQVPKYQQKYFLEEFGAKGDRPKFHTRYNPQCRDYYIDEDGLIQTNIKKRVSKPAVIYSNDYQTEQYNTLTGLPIKRCNRLNYMTGLCEVFGQTKKYKWSTNWYKLNEKFVGERVISGYATTFSSKKDFRYVRIIAEQNKRQLKIDKQRKSTRWKISEEDFRRILREKQLKEYKLNLIKIESHGFDPLLSFRKEKKAA